jgi:hypothetical protein
MLLIFVFLMPTAQLTTSIILGVSGWEFFPNGSNASYVSSVLIISSQQRHAGTDPVATASSL